MGLTIQRRISTKARVITTLVALFALVAQPMYGLVAGQVANATSHVTTSELKVADDGFYCFNDATDVASGAIAGQCEIVANPDDSSKSAVKLTTNTGKMAIATNKYAGMSLLNARGSYTTAQVGDTNQSIYMNINVNFNANGLNSTSGLNGNPSGWQGRVYQVPTSVSKNGAWVTVDPSDPSALWTWSGFSANGNKWPNGDTQSTLTSTQMLTKYPHMAVANDALGQILWRASTGSAPFTGYISNISFTTGTGVHNYDFKVTPSLVAGDFTTWDNAPAFEGFNVGFQAANFGTVSSVKIDVSRADGSHVYKQAGPDMLALLSGKTNLTGGSAPIIVQAGTYDDTADTYWSPQTYSSNAAAYWAPSTKPMAVTVTVVGTNGTQSVTMSPFTETAGAPYVELLPIDVQKPKASFQVQPPSVVSGQFKTRLVVGGEVGVISKSIYIDSEAAANLCRSDISAGRNLDAQCDVTNLSEGVHHLVGVAVDEAGNRSTVSSASFTVDHTAPLAPKNLAIRAKATSGFIPSGGSTNVEHNTLTWKKSTSTDVDHYVYKFWTDFDDYTQANPWTTEKDGNRGMITPAADNRSVIDVNFYAEGTYFFCVTAVDKVGHESDCSTTYSVEYDTTGPTASISTIPNIVSGDTIKSPLVLTGTSNENVKHWIDVTAPNGTSYTWGTSGSLTKSAILDILSAQDKNKVFIPTINGQLVDGTYTVRYVVNDRAGNRSDHLNTPQFTSTVFKFTIDNTAPVVKFDGYTGTSTTPVLTGTSDADKVTIVVGDRTGVDVDVVDGIWTHQVPATNPLTRGVPYNITVTATDAAGNVGTTTVQDVDGNDVFATFTIASPFSGTGVTGETIPELPTSTDADRSANTGLFRPSFNTVGAPSFVADPSEVLGAQDSKDTGILGASKDVAAIAPSAQGWKIFGLAWYWLLLAVAAIASIWWWIAAARRRSQEA